jgi:hypothetical protein
VETLSSESEAKPRRLRQTPRFRLHHSLRWLHTYLSMFSLMVILFFALTGITLNHPEWTFGLKESTRTVKGHLPAAALAGGRVDWLRVVEQLRAEHHLRGQAQDTRVDAGEGSLTFRGPGYSADCFFKMSTGEYEVTTTDQGFVGLLNDLHRGKDAGPTWSRLIDVSGAFLSLLAVTGLGILFYLKKARATGLVVMATGVLVVILLAVAAR